MFAFLSPRVLMLIGVIAALIGAFFFGVKFERGQYAEAELKKKAAYEAEVAQVREKSRAVEEQTARALEAEQKKSQELSGRIAQAMKELDAKHASGIKVNCPRPAPAHPAPLQVKAMQEAPHAPSGSSSSADMPGQVATGPSMDAAAGQTTPISSTEAEMQEDEKVDIALDDHIFYADFVGLYNAAATRQPERLPETAGRSDGGSAAAGSVSGRDIIDNVDENGKRFAECREKLKAWQNWARKMDLAK
jgi:hypothetical protein